MLRFAPARGAAAFALSSAIRGPTGSAGADGHDGAAATVSINSTSTLAAGASATASNAGSSSAAAFNFGFPRGADSGMRYAFESSTTMAAPAAGGMRLNNASLASVSAIAVNATNSDGVDVSDFIATWDDSTNTTKGTVEIRKEGSGAVLGIFTLGTVTDNTTWLEIALTYVSGSGSFSAADAVYLTPYLTGNKGADGAGTGDVSGPAASVDSEIVLFNSTTGKLIKRASLTGLVKATSGVASAATANTDYLPVASPVMTTPTLGVATATSINGNTFTTGTYTLTGTAGKTFTFSNTLTLAGTDASTLNVGDGATITGSSSAAIYYDNIPQNSQSTAYTLVLADAQKHILHPTADNNARTFTIPANSSVAYPIGTAITFINEINTVTIAITSDTLKLAGTGSTGSRTLAANGIATAIKTASTTWWISGTGLT